MVRVSVVEEDVEASSARETIVESKSSVPNHILTLWSNSYRLPPPVASSDLSMKIYIIPGKNTHAKY